MEFSTLLDDLNEPIAVLNSDLRVVYVNKYFYTFAKISPRVLSSAPLLSEIFENRNYDLELDSKKCLTEKSIIRSGELDLKALKGDIIYKGVVKLIPIAAGEDYFIMWTFLDFTNEHELQQKYRLQLDELKDNHNLLVRGNKHQAIGEVYETISHEVNNPLTSSLFYLETLQNKCNEKKIKKDELLQLVGNISSQVKTVANIVSNLKRYLTFNTSKKEYLDILDVIERSHELSKTLRIFDGINFTLKTSFDSLAIWGNKTELTQIFVNLFKNAAESFEGFDTDEKTIVVEVNEDSVEQQYVVVVSDTGIGMSQSMLESAFEPFNSSKNANKGSGLGLSIVKKIIDDHNAIIDIDSKIGNGTAFTMNFPSLELSSFVNNELMTRAVIDEKKIVLVLNNLSLLNKLNPILLEKDYLVMIVNSFDCKQEIYSDFEGKLVVTDDEKLVSSCMKVLYVKNDDDIQGIISKIEKEL